MKKRTGKLRTKARAAVKKRATSALAKLVANLDERVKKLEAHLHSQMVEIPEGPKDESQTPS